jgi:hypothetical protein
VLSSLVEVLRSLRSFALSTDDSLSNRFCCDHLLKKLDACARLEWKVGVLVEDSGECFVPFAREEAEGAGEEADAESGGGVDADVKYMDLTFLNELIQSELSHASIEIIPQ